MRKSSAFLPDVNNLPRLLLMTNRRHRADVRTQHNIKSNGSETTYPALDPHAAFAIVNHAIDPAGNHALQLAQESGLCALSALVRELLADSLAGCRLCCACDGIKDVEAGYPGVGGGGEGGVEFVEGGDDVVVVCDVVEGEAGELGDLGGGEAGGGEGVVEERVESGGGAVRGGHGACGSPFRQRASEISSPPGDSATCAVAGVTSPGDVALPGYKHLF